MKVEESETNDGKEIVLFKPYFVEISCDKHIVVNEKQLSKRLTKEFCVEVAAVLVQRKKGVLIINKFDKDFEHQKDSIFGNPQTVFGFTFQFREIPEEQQLALYEKHYNALCVALKTKYNATVSKKESNKAKILYDEEFGPVEVQANKFNNIRQLKDKMKLVVQITGNDSKIPEQHFEWVKEVL